MSILLDALRKSERRERLGDVPDIHGAPETTPDRAGRTPVLVVGAVLVLTLAGGFGWWAWNASPTSGAPPAIEAEQASAVDPPAERASGSGARADAERPAGPGNVPEGGSEGAPATTAPRLDRQPRSPVEVLSGERPYRSASPSAELAESGSRNTAVETAPRDGVYPQAASPTSGRPTSGFGDPDVLDALTRAVEQTGMEGAEEAQPEVPPASPPPRPAAPAEDDRGLISYWQLPQDVRSGLPELRITVLVWDEAPEARFLIMGGRRFLEGDRVATNLTVEEIRRDRVLLRHGAYRFYVKQ